MWLSPHMDPVTRGMLGCRRLTLCCPPCSSSPQLVLPREVPYFPQVWRTTLRSERCLSADKSCATSSMLRAPGVKASAWSTKANWGWTLLWSEAGTAQEDCLETLPDRAFATVLWLLPPSVSKTTTTM